MAMPLPWILKNCNSNVILSSADPFYYTASWDMNSDLVICPVFSESFCQNLLANVDLHVFFHYAAGSFIPLLITASFQSFHCQKMWIENGNNPNQQLHALPPNFFIFRGFTRKDSTIGRGRGKKTSPLLSPETYRFVTNDSPETNSQIWIRNGWYFWNTKRWVAEEMSQM